MEELQMKNVKANHTHLRTSLHKTLEEQKEKQEKV